MYSRPSSSPRAIDNGTAQNSATSTTPERTSAPVATNAATARVRTIETTSSGVRVRRVSGLAWRSRSSSESATATRSTTLLTRKVVWKNAARVGESDTRRALARALLATRHQAAGQGDLRREEHHGQPQHRGDDRRGRDDDAVAPCAQPARREREHHPDQHELRHPAERAGERVDPLDVRGGQAAHGVGRGEDEQQVGDAPVRWAGPEHQGDTPHQQDTDDDVDDRGDVDHRRAVRGHHRGNRGQCQPGRGQPDERRGGSSHPVEASR